MTSRLSVLLLLGFLGLPFPPTVADVPGTPPTTAIASQTAADILARVRENLPKETLWIKGKLLRGERLGRLEPAFHIDVLLEWGKHPPSARYTLNDAFGTCLEQLTIVRKPGHEPEFRYEKGHPLQPASTPDLNKAIEGTDLTWNDLSLSFLWWPNGSIAGRDNLRGRNCIVLEMTPPPADGASNARSSYQAPNGTLRLWIDDKLLVLIQMEEYDKEGQLRRRLSVKNFKKIADLWMIKNMDIRRYPSHHRTQIRIDEVISGASSNAPDMDLAK